MSDDREARTEPVLSVPTPKEGEFDLDDRLTSDRRRFLWLVSGKATHVLRDLMDTVAQVSEEEREEALDQWSKRHCLDADWIRDVARETAEAMSDPEQWAWWCDLRRRLKRLARLNRYRHPYDPDWMWAGTAAKTRVFLDAPWTEERFVFTYRPPYPDREQWGDYAEEARGAFAEALRAQWEARCHALESDGRQKAARKRGEAQWNHVEWFIQSQVLRKTHKQIADAAGVKETKRVAEACKDVSERIGLRRRTLEG